jgi:serine/threonine protein kinase
VRLDVNRCTEALVSKLMPLGPGSRIGPYEVTALLGTGGMGEVWRAHHAGLKRDDALKVLPDEFAADPERLARFQREAQVLASLNHPNIAHVYGLEQGDPSTGSGQAAVRALVMELVEGPTLANRIAEGAIPIDEALPIAKQIAEALEAAHEQGIIHRDLKPANIKLRPDGTVKVLDFGLAKIMEPSGAGEAGRAAEAARSQSPTITNPAMRTGVGVLLGTAAYMSPEQAKGRVADKRSDIWAFGCVLYEMLTGKRAFEGEDVSETLAAVLRGEPDWSLLPPSAPSFVLQLLRGSLQKDWKQRISDIAVARYELDAASVPPETSATKSRTRVLERVAWALVVAVLGIATGLNYLARPAIPPAPSRITLAIYPPEGTGFPITGNVAAAFPTVSPDGRQLAFVVRNATGVSQLALRTLSTADLRLLPGTDGADAPFWSPDSRELGSFPQQGEGQLQRVDVSGGMPRAIATTPGLQGGAWNAEGRILFTGRTGGLFSVASAGGEPIPVTALDAAQKEESHRGPAFLPDGRHFLYLDRVSVKRIGPDRNLHRGVSEIRSEDGDIDGRWRGAALEG